MIQLLLTAITFAVSNLRMGDFDYLLRAAPKLIHKSWITLLTFRKICLVIVFFPNPLNWIWSCVFFAFHLAKQARIRKQTSVISAQCQNRADLWTNVIKEEARYIDLIITHIIDAEVRHSVATQHIDDALELFSADYYVMTRRQASHVYHNLYRGDRDQVQVIVVTQYFPSNGKHCGCFMVRLATKNVKTSTRSVIGKSWTLKLE